MSTRDLPDGLGYPPFTISGADLPFDVATLPEFANEIRRQMVQKKRPYDFFINVAKLYQRVESARRSSSKVTPSELADAELLIAELKQKDLFCSDAWIARDSDSDQLQEPSASQPSPPSHCPTLDDGGDGRPLLISGGAFEMNRKRH